jgi:hypothetical protein
MAAAKFVFPDGAVFGEPLPSPHHVMFSKLKELLYSDTCVLKAIAIAV